MLPEPSSWNRDEARAGRFDGAFIVGVLSTGIYCLPSCAARPPKPENVRVLATEAEARAAGLRPCKRCRPDLFYSGHDPERALFEALATRVRAAPGDFRDAAALARAGGVSQTKLGAVFRAHAHSTPAAWLKREQVRHACRLLLTTERRVVEVGEAAGFDSESAFHRQFLAVTRMTPGGYRGLLGASVFMLALPAGYRAAEVLAYHARDPASRTERVTGSTILKALAGPRRPLVLEIELEPQAAWCRVHGGYALDEHVMAGLHERALRMLGLAGDAAGFELRAARDARVAALLASRRGLRLPLTPTVFEGLCWAIVGQQVNIAFAGALRREIVALAGDAVADMRVHPTAERVAELDARELTRRRFSRAKAEYVLGAARAVASGSLRSEDLPFGSAVAAERALLALRGVGPWTARYTLLRGAGFADCAPVGDAALAAALQRFTGAAARPAPAEVEALMRPFAPHRSLATLHLWASLRDAA